MQFCWFFSLVSPSLKPKEHMELLGRNVWSHCIVVFTRGDWMGTPTIEEHIESEGENLQWRINKCGNRYHVLNNIQQDDGKQVSELMEKVEMMVIEKKELLTPEEQTVKGKESGLGSVMSDQDKLERGSLDKDQPNMDGDAIIMKWLENVDIEDYEMSSNFPEDFSEDVT